MRGVLVPVGVSCRAWWRVLACGVGVLGALWLAGCASGPASAPSARTGGVPEVKARNPDRDGPPMNPPADLASLPDPVPQIEPIRSGGPNKPYVVLGQSYQPLQGDVSWAERGGASWYGTKFHGRRTASGELYSMYGLTAAHKTLPIPSYVRVRNVRNGKEIIVRVNDRGPFHSKRIIDLSYAAALKLDLLGGVGEVELSRLTFEDIRTGAWQRGNALDSATQLASASPAPALAPAPAAAPAPASTSTLPLAAPRGTTVSAAPLPAITSDTGANADGAIVAAGGSSAIAPPPTAPSTPPPTARAYTPASKGFWVQVAALGKRDGVERLQQRIAAELAGLLPMLAVFHEPPLFKLQVGPYASRAEAQAAAAQARQTLQVSPLVIERR